MTELRHLAARAGRPVAPVMASVVIHALLLTAVLAIGLRAAPRLLPLVEAELVSLDRETPPAAVPPPALEPRRSIVTSAPVPKTSPPIMPTRPVEMPVARPEPPPPILEAPRPPPKLEEKPPPEERAKPAEKPAKLEDKPATAESKPARLEVESPSPGAGGPPGQAAATSPGMRTSEQSGGLAVASPERSTSIPAGRATGAGGSPEGVGTGPGTGVAAKLGSAGSGNASGTSGTGITRSAIPSGGYQVQPAYPASARRLGIQGTSLLRVYVAADGRVTEIVVARSAGHEDMDQAATEAVRKWRFEPGRRGEEAVGMWVVLPIEFRFKK